MYIPALYRNENRSEMVEFMRANPFGILISQDANARIIATHIPFHVTADDEQVILTTHVSKANPQWKSLNEVSEVLVIFQGAHTYISSSWYDHENVPTWDYTVVHVYGKVRLLDDVETRQHLSELMHQHEQLEKKPLRFEDMNQDFVQKEMKGLVALEVKATELFSAFKLSQNRDSKNLTLIIDQLEARGDENSMAIAAQLKIIQQQKDARI